MSSNVIEMRRQVEELRRSVDEASRSVGKYTSVIGGAARLARRMGLPENVQEQVKTIERLIMVINTLRAAYLALQVARMAAGDPLAWAGAIISIAGAGMTLVELGSG